MIYNDRVKDIGNIILNKYGFESINIENSYYEVTDPKFLALKIFGIRFMNSEQGFDRESSRGAGVPLVYEGKVFHNFTGTFDAKQQARMLEQADEDGNWWMIVKSEEMQDFLAVIEIKVPFRMSNGNFMHIRLWMHYRDINHNEASFQFRPADNGILDEEYEKAYVWIRLAA